MPSPRSERGSGPGGYDRRVSSTPHTQVPNLVQDVIMPHLELAEQACLHYIIRRTYGFVVATTGERKQRDVIALSQFVSGIRSGAHVIDFGTGLTKPTVTKALAGLEAKGLVNFAWSCLHCHWQEGTEEAAGSEIVPYGQGAACPRCRKSLSKSYGMHALSSKRVIRFLDAHAKGGGQWGFDRELARFYRLASEDVAVDAAEVAQAHLDEARRLHALLWYPEIVDELVEVASAQLKGRRGIATTRLINGFYKPVLELQEQYAKSPHIVHYALEQTRTHAILAKERNATWYRYAAAVAKNTAGTSRDRALRMERAGASQSDRRNVVDLREREISMRDLLGRAQRLNEDGETDAARALLSDLLGQAERLASLYDGDAGEVERRIRLCFKLGERDIRTVDQAVSPYDFYPEWSSPS